MELEIRDARAHGFEIPLDNNIGPVLWILITISVF